MDDAAGTGPSHPCPRTPPAMPTAGSHVVIVDDDPDICDALRFLLEADGMPRAAMPRRPSSCARRRKKTSPA